MKKGYISLMAVLIVSVFAFQAFAVASDFYRINTGAKSGTFNRTATPVCTYLLLNGSDTTGTVSNLITGEALVEYVPATLTTESASLKFCTKTNYTSTFEGAQATATKYIPFASAGLNVTKTITADATNVITIENGVITGWTVTY